MKTSVLKPVLALQFSEIVRSITSPASTAVRRPSFMRKLSQLPAISAVLVISALIFAFTIATPISVAQEAEPATPPAMQAPGYTPKYHGDPARSDSEFAALAYMRVV